MKIFLKLKGSKGYSLLEVLVGITLITLIILPLLSLFARGHYHNRAAGLKTKALLLGQEEMERLKATGYDDLRGKIMGDENSYLLPEDLWEEREGFICYYQLCLVEEGVEGREEELVMVNLIKAQVFVRWIEEGGGREEDGGERELRLVSFLAEVVRNEKEE